MSKNMTHNFAKEKTTVGMIQALAEMYEKPSANNKVYLMKKLFNLKMFESGLVVEYLNSFNTIVNQLVSVGIKFDDKICALILLASLPNSWEPMKAAIINSIGNAILKFIDVRNAILVKKVWRKDFGEASTSNLVLNVDGRGRNYERNKGNGKLGKSKNGMGKSRNGRNLECWNYGKTGHPKKDYKVPRKNEDKNDAANVVTDEVRDALILSIDDSYDSWVLDSGASFHTIAHCDLLENYLPGNHGNVYLADGEPLDVIGIGDVKLKMPNWSL